VRPLESGVVDQDVQPPELVYSATNQTLAVRFVGDVAGHGLAPGLGHQPRGLLRVTVFAQVGDQHISPLTREGQGDRPADAAVRARDQGRAAF